MGAVPGQSTVYALAGEYIKKKYNKPGNVFIGIVSRLDASASGVLVLARTSKAARRLSEQIRNQEPEKHYLAVVQGSMPQMNHSKSITHFLKKMDLQKRMKVCSAEAPGAQQAILSFQCLAAEPKYSLIAVQLVTGRKHQIRVQMAALGFPILGDAKYGGSQPWPSGIALHCLGVTLQHPTQRSMLRFTAEPEHWQGPLGAHNYKNMMELSFSNLNQSQ